jgi:outer membrane protein assembly factor BamB
MRNYRSLYGGGKMRKQYMLLVSLVLLASAALAAESPEEQARGILEASGSKGGLVVHLGCGSGELTAALRMNEKYIVQGLDADPENVRKAREYIRSRRLYGPVSVDTFDGERLPYADNLVNLVVAEDLGDVTNREVARVLEPGGTAYIREGDQWTKTVKQRPGDVDEWTHYLHDASGNPVARDQVVAPPRYAQWIEDPQYARSHEHTPSVAAVVSANGRIFYLVDEAPTSSILRSAEWYLVARDAYNGVLLWKRRVTDWWPHICGWTQGPNQLQRRLVAVGDSVYVTLGLHAPLISVDAATGQVLQTYDQSYGTEEILWHKGMLLLSVRSVTEERIAELKKWAELSKMEDSPLYARETMDPLRKQLRGIEAKAEMTLLAVNADTGSVIWKKDNKEIAGIRPLSLSAMGDRVFFQKGGKVVSLDLKTGKEVWLSASVRMRVVCDSCVICANDEAVTALSVETGETLWTQKPLLCNLRDAFVINGTLWLGGFKPYQEEGKPNRGPAWGPYFVTQRDLATGEVLKHIEPENPGHHHRCYINKATDRYILGGRRGTEFIDLETGEVLWHSWARGVCRYGVMPANGLLYVPPHACGCYTATKLIGFNALSPGIQETETRAADRLERGPAYSTGTRNPRPTHRSQEWPTYRHDAERSSYTRSVVPTALRQKWQVDAGGKLTSPTVAGNKVFVASVDGHRVSAMDADSGESLWDFTAGARVDSSPTVYGDWAVFGCRDGYVYSLRASDGALAWRLRAARAQRHIAVSGQLESASPVSGSVLIQDGVAYVTAGRSSYLDGGIDLHRLEPGTGKILSTTQIYSPDPETGKQPEQYGPNAMPGTRWDILTGDAQYIYLRDMVFDKDGANQSTGNPHLLSLTGLLDDAWAHRSYWIFGTKCSLSTGCSGRDRNLIYGRLLVFDDSTIYGYGRAGVHWSNQLQDGPYRAFAVKRDDRTALWAEPLPIQVRAMVLADKVLFMAGPAVKAVSWFAEDDEDQGALLLAVSIADGTELARYRLDCSPVLDGMAAANGRLYLSLENGRVVCLGEE